MGVYTDHLLYLYEMTIPFSGTFLDRSVNFKQWMFESNNLKDDVMIPCLIIVWMSYG